LGFRQFFIHFYIRSGENRNQRLVEVESMTMLLKPGEKAEIDYPDSDGQPMAENTEQFDWIVQIKLGLELMFVDNSEVFIAGDLLWYPVEGDNKTRMAPDVMVAFGRPKGRRGSYQQWKEGGIAPQVVFEVLSPGNRQSEMINKWRFYDRYGVEEYYVIDPMNKLVEGWLRSGGSLEVIEELKSWISPRLQIRFEIEEGEIRIYRPDGTLFEDYVEMAREREEVRQQAEKERQRADQEHQRAERLAERLRSLGADPDDI
jgi:Uma2 family endonuclease